MIYESIFELIGHSPLLHLNRIEKQYHLLASIYAKVEKFNPAGSIKDRAAYYMIKNGREKGLIQPHATLIEPTSGNTGIALACLANYYQYECIIVMPESASLERRKLITDYHGKLCLVKGGMKECIEKANELQQQIPNSFIPSQFENKSNPLAHYLTTGPEIFKDLQDIDVIVAGIGTGGTITGVGKYAKEINPKVEVIGVEPDASPLLSKGIVGVHRIQGIGANFIPSNYKSEYVDRIMTIKDEEAINTAKEMVKQEGILVGISSGAALCAAIKLAQDSNYRGKKIVVIMPDGGERYSWN